MNIFNRNRMALSLVLVLAVGTAWAHSKCAPLQAANPSTQPHFE